MVGCYINRSCSAQAATVEGSHHGNRNRIIYKKDAIHRTEMEMLFLPAKGFNTNLVQFLPLYVFSNIHVCSFTCTNVNGRAPKTVLRARNPVHEKF